MSDNERLLSEFLNTPLDSGDQIFDRFAALPKAVKDTGSAPLQRYVYIPGARKDRVVLVAHTDTVWDKAYNKPFSGAPAVEFQNGVFFSANPTCGIGADDRAGCAMLWELRNCGHSILLVDGEEHGKRGAHYLRKTNHKLFCELNRHCYMIELDWKGTNCCLFNQVDNTKKFKAHIETTLGFADSKAKGGTDLQVLCKDVCGVNIGIGYHGWHTEREQLVVSEWENTLAKLNAFLQQPQKRFRAKFFAPYLHFFKRCVNKALKIVKGIIRK